MKYKIYVYSYQYGLELTTIVSKKEDILDVVNNLDPYDYSHYVVTNNKNQIVDTGLVVKPNKKILKPRRKS